MWQVRAPFIAAGIYGAAGDPGLPEPWNYVLNYGLLAVFFGLVVTGRFVVLRREYDEMRAQRDQAVNEKNELRAKVDDQVTPLLSNAVRVLADFQKEATPEAKLAEQVAHLTALVEGLKR